MTRKLAPTFFLFALLLPVPSVSASTGGTRHENVSANGGGTAYGSAIPKPEARPTAMLRLSERTLVAGKTLPAVRFRIEQRGMEQVQARVVVLRAAGRAKIFRRSAGWVKTGRTITLRWPDDDVAPRSGRYVVRLHVKDSRGHTLRRTATHPGRTYLRVRPSPRPETPTAPGSPDVPIPVPLLPAPAASPGGKGVFPVVGTFSFGHRDSRFGAGRAGHVHQGQDIAASAGQTVVAPYAGTINSTAYQAGGAGEYVVLDGVDGRSYFFAHCTRNSTAVRRGQAVAAGAELCKVGATGTSNGPHLHFEIWQPGWRVKGSAPIDPLPELQAWSGR